MARTFYGIDENDTKLPSLVSDQDLLEWEQKVINRRTRTTRNGGETRIQSFHRFGESELRKLQTSLCRPEAIPAKLARCSAEVAQYRGEADEYILTLWNEIEGSLRRPRRRRNTPPEMRTFRPSLRLPQR